MINNIEVPKEVIEFFKAHGSMAMPNMEETWLYFPFWLCQKDGKVEVYSFDQLPAHLKDFIEKHRNAFTERLIDKSSP